MEKMRATRIPEKGKIVCETVDRVPPREGQVVVRTIWAAICGSDLHVLHSEVPLPERASTPGFPGHEGVGVITESRHAGFAEGQRVLTCPSRPNPTGTFVDYQTIDGKFLVPLPDTDVPMEHMLMAQQFGTTIFALRQHPVDVVGKTVIVQGQGSAGWFFAYNLKRAGAARVIVSDLSEARLALSKHFGADLAVRASGDNVRQAVMDETGGKGVDYLVEAVGNREALAESIGLIRPQGNALYFGQPDSKELVPFNFHDFQRNRLTINATTGTQHEPGLVSFKLALQLIVNGEMDVSPMISHIYELDKIEDAMRRAHLRDDNARKVVIKI
ncbi:MAG: zinc-binding dehydrogenase [SAR324 cluster bacterium]|nr:zinc-binding dehydrogenase [SAR324 cluster bacterium]